LRPSEALAHCGECHTPRNAAFALDNRKKFSGALAAGWHAFNITSDKSTGVGSWSDDELFAYLAQGHAEGRGTAAGPMGEAVGCELQPNGTRGHPRAGCLARRTCAEFLCRMRCITIRSAHTWHYRKMRQLHRPVQRSGAIIAIPILAGLHHQYVRI
jgi:hypothetical protein